MGDEINWAKWRYQIRRRNERRRNRTPEQKFEHEQLRLESQRRKIIREFEKRFGIDDESNRNTDEH